MREVAMFLAIIALSVGWFIDHAAMQFAQLHLKYRSQSSLYENKNGTIVVTEHHKPGFIGTQVWQVWRAPSDGTEPTALMTVEAGFFDPPLQPELQRADDSIVITDKAKSFTFDPERGSFIENKSPRCVYRGSFRYSLPPFNNP